MSVIPNPSNTPAAWSERAATEPTPWGAAGWTRESQIDRFKQVVKALDPQPGENLLDFGCATGELVNYLHPQVNYVGFDPAQGMVTRARREHPGRQFQTWEPHNLHHDITACIGCWNLAEGWHKELTWAALRRLWDGTGRALAASLYAGDDEHCLRYTEAECVKFASGESYRWQVDRWRPNDILIVLDRGPRKRASSFKDAA